MYEYDAWASAITGIDKYKPIKEYESVKVPLNSMQILWADYIVFPFTFVFVEKPKTARNLSVKEQLSWQVNDTFNYIIIQECRSNLVVSALRRSKCSTRHHDAGSTLV